MANAGWSFSRAKKSCLVVGVLWLAILIAFTGLHSLFSFWSWAGCYGPADNPASHRMWRIASAPLVSIFPERVTNEYFDFLMTANSVLWGAGLTAALAGAIWIVSRAFNR